VTYEIRNGWIEGKLRGLNGDLFPVKHFPQGPYDRRQRGHPRLCLHTTETGGYVQNLRFPSEFQVGEGIIGQHKPLWARGEAVDELDEQVLQVEIVGRSQLGVWLPRPTSLNPLVALLALLHRRHFVATAQVRPSENRWPLELDRLPASVASYYRRHEIWDRPFIYGHVEMRGDEHWDPGSLDYPTLFSMVRAVLNDGKEPDVALTETQREGIEFANGMKRYLEGGSEPADPGPHRRGWRFARDMKEHAAHPIDPTSEPTVEESGYEPRRSDTEGMTLSPEEHHPGPEEEEAQRREQQT
jgi:hypothetical protein